MVYRNVEIIDSAGNPIGEFDKIEDGVLIEEKSAIDISKLNPRTGKPFQTIDDWAARQIFVKTDIRIQNLEKAVNTRPTREGSSDVPTLEDIRKIRKFQFQIKSNDPEVKIAVENQLNLLRQNYPDWDFFANFGD